MKKLLAFCAALIFAVALTGCTQQPNSTQQPSHAQTPVLPRNGTEVWSVNSYATYAETAFALSENDASILKDFLSSDDWVNDLPDCLCDVWFECSDGTKIQYHSSSGTFVDITEKQSLPLNDNDKNTINCLIEKYCSLGLFTVK